MTDFARKPEDEVTGVIPAATGREWPEDAGL
jgi:hypothetical protein